MTYMVLLLVFSVWVYGLAVGSDRATHEANERLSKVVEGGALASWWGNNATMALRTVAGVGLASVALLDATWLSVGVVSGMLLFLAYYTLGVAWRNYLLLIGRDDLERRYEGNLWDEIIWIRYYRRREWL